MFSRVFYRLHHVSRVCHWYAVVSIDCNIEHFIAAVVASECEINKVEFEIADSK